MKRKLVWITAAAFLSPVAFGETSRTLHMESRICQEHLGVVAAKAQAEEALKSAPAGAAEGIRTIIRQQESEFRKTQQKYRKETGRDFDLAKCKTEDSLKNLKARMGKKQDGKKDPRESSVEEVSEILDPPTMLQALCQLAALPPDTPTAKDGKKASEISSELKAAYKRKTGKAADLSRCGN